MMFHFVLMQSISYGSGNYTPLNIFEITHKCYELQCAKQEITLATFSFQCSVKTR